MVPGFQKYQVPISFAIPSKDCMNLCIKMEYEPCHNIKLTNTVLIWPFLRNDKMLDIEVDGEAYHRRLGWVLMRRSKIRNKRLMNRDGMSSGFGYMKLEMI